MNLDASRVTRVLVLLPVDPAGARRVDSGEDRTLTRRETLRTVRGAERTAPLTHPRNAESR